MPKKGYKQTEEHKRKIGKLFKGKPKSKEHKRKLSIAHKGSKLSEKTKKKISDSHKREKAYQWKGGISPINKRIRMSIEYRLWREAVFARDNWTCQKCKTRGIRLHPHHIQNFSQYPELRFAIDNGITFCKNCHIEFHKKYWIKNNTKEQLNNFVFWDRNKF